ncbi:MAG: glycosyltransferase family 2 protein [Pseudomonadota bacterium]
MSDATVIVAAWNAEATVARSIASGLSQTGACAHVVVANDASTDGTAALLERMAAEEPRLTAVHLAENGGPGAARNAALDAASGDWVAVLDADDTMRPERLADMIALAEAEGALVLGNVLRVDEAGSALGGPFLEEADWPAPRALDLAAFVAGNQARPGVPSLGYLKPLFRRAFLEAHGLRYDPSLRNGEDCHLVFECLAAGGRLVVSPAADYFYTVRGGSISSRANPAHMEALIAAGERFLARETDRIDPAARAGFESRHAALTDLMTTEQVMRALKGRRIGEAARLVWHRPRIWRRLARQLSEGAKKRAGA